MPAISSVNPSPQMSSTLAINTKVRALRAQGHSVLQLGFGEARFPVHPLVLAALKAHAAERSYLPVAGLPELRAAIAAYYRRRMGINAAAGQVIVGSGSKSLLFAALHALKGDLLLPIPSWVSYETHAFLTGKTTHWIPTSFENNHCLTAEDLAAGIKAAKTAGASPGILILNSPHNPTGVMYPPALLESLAQVAKAENITIISDEIYALTAYGDVPHTSIARYYPEGTIITGGLSKHLSLGGWRLGAAIVPDNEFGQALHRYMSAVAGAIWTTAAAPIQYAAIVAYSNNPEIDAYVDACTAVHGYVTGYLYGVMQALHIPAPQPAGGFYLFPGFAPWRAALAEKHHVRTSQQLADLLLQEANCATLPGSDFGADPLDLTLRLATSYLYAQTDAEAEAVLEAHRNNLSPADLLRQTCPGVLEMEERLRQFVAGLGKPG